MGLSRRLLSLIDLSRAHSISGDDLFRRTVKEMVSHCEKTATDRRGLLASGDT